MATNPLDANQRLRIIVLGYIVRGPLGGMAWKDLQFVLGLARLGHEVYFIEDSDDYPSCYDPVRGYTDTDPSYGLAFASAAFERIGFGDRWAYYDAHQPRWLGPASDRILAICQDAELLFNVCGINPLRPWLCEIPHRVFIDQDPVFTQVHHLTEVGRKQLAEQHTAFFSFGENIATDSSQVPDDGFPWQSTRQPVVLDFWPATAAKPLGKFTTVMQWESYSQRDYLGQHFGMKSESFPAYLDLPKCAGRIFEVAVGGQTAYDLLHPNGWSIRHPLEITRDPASYERYLRESKAEFSVAKHGYVVSHSGWFSERSVAYLASGRPAIVQDTGFSKWLPSGAGVISFHNPEQALAAIDQVNAQYLLHCRAAREIAEAFFDSNQVLKSLIDRALNGTHPSSS
jgi:hypothetical protein